MWGMLRSQAASFNNRNRVTRSERPKDCSQSSFPSSIFRVDQHKMVQRNISARIDGIELSDISEELDEVYHVRYLADYISRTQYSFGKTPSCAGIVAHTGHTSNELRVGLNSSDVVERHLPINHICHVAPIAEELHHLVASPCHLCPSRFRFGVLL